MKSIYFQPRPGSTAFIWSILPGFLDPLNKAFRPHKLGELSGLSGAESIPLLQAAIANLGDEISAKPWEPADGNIKKQLFGLLKKARVAPHGRWGIDV